MDYFFTLIIFKLKYLFRILVFPIKIEIINKMIVLNTNVEQLIKTFVLILITLCIIERSIHYQYYFRYIVPYTINYLIATIIDYCLSNRSKNSSAHQSCHF